MTTGKLDFKKLNKDQYSPSPKAVSLITVPQYNFLKIDGKGDPNGPEFQEAVQALYSISYTLKFWSKGHSVPNGWQEFSVAPLEALWWVAGNDQKTMNMNVDRSLWRWTAMLRQPDFIDLQLVSAARTEVETKKQSPSLSRVRFESFEEGIAVQILHIGPYADELPNILKITNYMNEHGFESNGLHHEIYLGDPRRTSPDKLKTVLRHPVKKV
jgi:hypothetical protein